MALDLGKIRDNIDGIDKQLVELFEKRMELCREVADGKMYLILEKGRSSEDKYKIFTNMLMEYAEFDSSKPERAAYIKEHFQVYIKANAINIIKKYCS